MAILMVEQPQVIDGILRNSAVYLMDTLLSKQIYLMLILLGLDATVRTRYLDNSLIIFLKSSYNIRDIQSIVVYGQLS